MSVVYPDTLAVPHSRRSCNWPSGLPHARGTQRSWYACNKVMLSEVQTSETSSACRSVPKRGDLVLALHVEMPPFPEPPGATTTAEYKRLIQNQARIHMQPSSGGRDMELSESSNSQLDSFHVYLIFHSSMSLPLQSGSLQFLPPTLPFP